MAQTTASASTETTTKEGVQIKGKDVILLNAPEVLLSPDTPLLTEAQDVAGAINELFMLDPGGGDEDWQPPDDWLVVPEPEPWEACFLVDMQNTLTHQFYFGDPDYNGNRGYGHITVDWGDGTVDSFDGQEHDENGNYIGGTSWSDKLIHTYSANGQYIIKVTTTEHNCLLVTADDNNMRKSTLLIAKLGEKIQLEDYNGLKLFGPFNGCVRLHWVSVKSGTNIPYACFQNCYALRKIDLKSPIAVIPDYCFFRTYSLKFPDFSQVTSVGYNAFSSAYALKKISLPKCTKIGDYAFTDILTLAEIYAPLCKNVGEYAFNNASSLEKAVFAEDCVFGTNCFSNCYNLYPRPDGSIQ